MRLGAWYQIITSDHNLSVSDQNHEMEDSNDAAEATTSAQSQKFAPAHEFPTAHFYSIEYPGYVRPESVSKAIHTLGGQSSIDRAFRRSAPREDSLFELNLRPDNPFSHPLLGDLVPTNNILLKVVKRKRKQLRPDDVDGAQAVEGEYTAVAVGVIPKTARFRSEQILVASPIHTSDEIMFFLFEVWPTFSTNPPKMTLFQNYAGQWLPWTVSASSLSSLSCSSSFLVSELSDDNAVEGIRGYRLPQETEDYTTEDPSAMGVDIDPQLAGRSHPEAQHSTQRSNLRLFPPPIFSRQGIPQNYKYVSPLPSGSFRKRVCFAYV